MADELRDRAKSFRSLITLCFAASSASIVSLAKALFSGNADVEKLRPIAAREEILLNGMAPPRSSRMMGGSIIRSGERPRGAGMVGFNSCAHPRYNL